MFKKLLLASCVSVAMLGGVAQATPMYSHDAKFDDQLSFSKPFSDNHGMFGQHASSKMRLSGEFDFGSRSSFQYGLLYRGGKHSGFTHNVYRDQHLEYGGGENGYHEYEYQHECEGNCDTVSVPEPTTLALFGLGLLGFGLSRSKKRQA